MKRPYPSPYSIGLFVLSLSLAILFLHAPGTSDVRYFIQWMDAIERFGIVDGYGQMINLSAFRYPPGTFIILSIASKLGMLLQLNSWESFKFILFFFLLLTSAVFYACTRNLPLTTLFQSVLTLSVGLGYVDIFTAPFLILSLFALKSGRVAISAALFSVSFIMKFQPLILAPFLAIYILNIGSLREIPRIDLRRASRALLAASFAPSIMLLVFGSGFLGAFGNTVRAQSLSGYALNLPWILTFLLHVIAPDTYEGLSDGAITIIGHPEGLLYLGPYLVFLLIYGLILLRFLNSQKTFPNLLLYCLAGFLAYFILATDVHENHLFTAFVIAALLVHASSAFHAQSLFWSFAGNLNMFIFYGVDGRGPPFDHVINGFDLSLLFAIAFVVMFGVELTKLPIEAKEIERAPERTGLESLASETGVS